MRVYWLNGSLTIQPENKKERGLLAELSKDVKFGPPDDHRFPGGHTESGAHCFDEGLVGDHQSAPMSLASERNDEKAIVGIDKTHKVVVDFRQGKDLLEGS